MFSRLSRVVLGGLLATGLAVSASAVAQTKVTAGVSVSFEGMLPIWIANEKGYFKDEKIDLEMIDFKGGGPAVQAFAGGSIDVLFAATDHALRLRNRGMNTVVLHGLDGYHNYSLIGKAGIPTSLVGMKGKTLGISSPGSMTDNTIRWAIKDKKLDPDRDYQIAGAGTGAAMLASIDSGKVDAGLVVQTDAAFLLAKKKDAYTVVEDYTKLPYAGYSVLALETWVAKNNDTAQGIIRAVARGAAEMEKNPQSAYPIIKKLYPHFTDELVASTVKSAVARIPKGGQFSAEAVRNTNAIVIATEPKLTPMTPESLKPKL